ncbi:MAG: hypothetical protein SGJ09_05570 [Phycisphaerae bacterium]|nr:hypothetical protein [Phycisphaerae bacterium]
MSDLHDELQVAYDDRATLSSPRMARTSAIAGVASILLAPIVVGFLLAAIGLHSAITHLRFRERSRSLAWFGIVASAVGALASAGAAVLWGSVLMTVLLQRSAIHQAQTWEGTTAGNWSLTDLDGETHTSSAVKGRIVFIDCFAPSSPSSSRTTPALASFAAAHSEIFALSWGPDVDATAALDFASASGVRHAVAVGAQSMPVPFSEIAAKPTLLVIDAEGIIRNVVLGRYDEKDLVKLFDAAKLRRPR